jgi:glucose/galactose transporter
MGICNKVAGILSPIILSSIVLKGATAIEQQVLTMQDPLEKARLLDALALRVIAPYVVMSIVLALLAFMIRKSALPEINLENGLDTDGEDVSSTKTSIWQFPNLLLGALGIFFYVGAEVMAGDGIGIYGKSLGFALDQTKYFTSFTLVGMLSGYILSIILIPKYIAQQTYLKFSALLALVITISVYFTTGSTAVSAIAALGFANAVMWPAIFPLAIRGLGRFTQTGSAFLIMGIAGGAIMPQIYGLLEASIGYQLAFQVVMLPCYAYVLYFALRSE